jgi:hypothetical protein
MKLFRQPSIAQSKGIGQGSEISNLAKYSNINGLNLYCLMKGGEKGRGRKAMVSRTFASPCFCVLMKALSTFKNGIPQ